MSGTGEFCTWCGRELIDKPERGLFDTKTGAREVTVWRECPRFTRSWRTLWLGGCHESHDRDNPSSARMYR